MTSPGMKQLIQKEALKMVQTIMWRLLFWFHLPSVFCGEESSASAAICRTWTHLTQIQNSHKHGPCYTGRIDQPWLWWNWLDCFDFWHRIIWTQTISYISLLEQYLVIQLYGIKHRCFMLCGITLYKFNNI
jgi:hypothetical protein